MDKQPPGEPVWIIEQTVATEVGKTEADDSTDYPAAVLWEPDPEQRHGWREFYVKKAAPKPNGKGMGFKK